MGSLSNLYISQSYQSLIHLGNDTTITATSVELQDGAGNGTGVFLNSLGDVFLSGSLSASLQQGYTWVGDSNNRTKLVSTSSFGSAINLTSLNAFTASQETKNATLASVTASLNANTASQQSQINSLISATGSYALTSSIVPLTSLNAYTASQDTKNSTLATYTASVDTKFTAVGASTASLNAFTSSQDTKNSTLASVTSSLITSASNAAVSNSVDATKWNTLGGQTGSYVTSAITASSLVTASVNLNTITFTKGNGTTFAVTVNTGSGGGTSDLTSLNAFTASQDTKNATLATYTASVDTKFVAVGESTASLNSFTASQNTINNNVANSASLYNAKFDNIASQSGSWVNVPLDSLNAFTASQDTKNSTLASVTSSLQQQLTNIGSQSGSWITESETGSFAYINKDNAWSANQTFTNITAVSASFTYVQTTYETSSIIYSSGSNQFGDEISDIQTLSGSVKVQGSLTVNGTPVQTSSVDISSLNAYTASNDTKWSTLGGQTGSYVTSAITASSLVTASAAGANITFTKGDNTQFTVTVATGSATNAQTASIASNLVITARNGGASTLAAGTVVHITGASGDNPIFTTASYDNEALSSNTFGLLRYSSPSGADVEVVVGGIVTSVNTDPALGYAAGDILYLSSSGQFTNIQPQAPNQIVTLGQVLRAQQNNGSVYVSINNGWELNELHNVQINNPQTGDLIQYESSSYGLWKNKTIDGAGIATTASFNSYTSSNDTKWSNLGSQSGSWITESETGSFATLQSNLFNGNQTISGSLLNQGNVKVLGGGTLSIQANTAGSGSLYSNVQIVVDTATDPTNVYSSYQAVDSFNNGLFGISINSYSGQEGAVPAFYFYGGGQNVSNTPIMTASPNDNNINFWKTNNIFKGNLTVTGSTNITTLTASLQEGYVWVGAANGKTTTVSTSSFQSYTSGSVPEGTISSSAQILNYGIFATTGSNTFIGAQSISGALSVTGNGLFGDYTTNQYPALQTKVSTTTNPGNIYSSVGIKNDSDALGSAGIYASTFTSFGSGLVAGIYGGLGGNKLAGDGGNTAIYLHDAVMEIVKDTKVSGSLEVSSSLKVNGSEVVVSSQTGSFIINTGSFATTGSNVFVGDQTLSDGSGNNSTISTYSGSIALVAKSYTSGSAGLSYFSASANQVNLIFKATSTTSDTVISGSNNIIANPTTPTAGFKRVITTGNIGIGPNALPQFSASMAFSPTVNGNYFASPGNASMVVRGPVSSSTYSIQANVIAGGSINLGTSTTLTYEKAVNGTNFSSNYINGQVNVTAYKTTFTGGAALSVGGSSIGGQITLNQDSSSISFSNNTHQGNGTVINNSYYNAAAGNANGLAIASNAIFGNSHLIQAAGANTSTTQQRQFVNNLIAGYFNTASVNLSGDLSHMVGTAILGHSLSVTGSSATSTTSAKNSTFGSAFLGRFNAEDGNRARTAETVFAVGTGTTTARKTGFLIDSGSNTFVEGTLNVSGALNISGGVYSPPISLSITSQTASLDATLGSTYTLTLVSGSTTHILVSGQRLGQTYNLLVTQPSVGTGSIEMGPNIYQPSGSLYIPTPASNAEDILTFVTFNNTAKTYIANVTNFI